jgi:hypothetical protein
MSNSPFRRFANKISELTKNNRNVTVVHVGNNELRLKYSNDTYVNYRLANNRRGVELAYGRTNVADRRKGLGTRLRNYGVKAARASHVHLWQYSVNVNMLVPSGSKPPSAIIMERLGAQWTRGIPRRYSNGKISIVKKRWASIVRGHRYPTRSKGSSPQSRTNS